MKEVHKFLIGLAVIAGVVGIFSVLTANLVVNMVIGLMIAVVIFLALCIYSFPAMFAEERNKKQKDAITVLNILAGWTVIGWFAALLWATLRD